jgi:hypothetical protein
MRKHIFPLASSFVVTGAAALTGCGAPPIEQASTLDVEFTAAAGHEDRLATTPRIALLSARTFLNGDGRVYEAVLREVAASTPTANTLRIDLAAEAEKAATLRAAGDLPPSDAAALVLLGPDAPAEKTLHTSDEDFGADPVFTLGDVVPHLTAEQTEALGIVAILPVHVLITNGEPSFADDVFRDARSCDEDLTYPETTACASVPLDAGIHVGALDPARADYAAVNAWELCANGVWNDMTTEFAGFLSTAPADELTAAQVDECGEHPGNKGRVERIANGRFAFEIGGASDLMRGLDAGE